MPIPINVQWLRGNWRAGWALDLHSIAGSKRPDGGFDIQRTPLGEMLYQLKYHLKQEMLEPISEAAAEFLKTRTVFHWLTGIIPTPPSKLDRSVQPVEELAIRIGQRAQLRVRGDYLVKIRSTDPLKGIDDPTRRKGQLEGAFSVKDDSLAGKGVLVFDDLYRSGETLKAITETLYAHGKLARVYVLTVTKTRTRR